MGSPLDEVRVIDFSIWRPGPYCTQLLGELGADVIKVEPPGGDPMRAFPDLFSRLNAGKRPVTLDLKQADEREAALALVADAHVLVEGFRPGVMGRLGVGADVVGRDNPGLVYCSISGYGQSGPRCDLPGHDLNYQAWAGTLEPRRPDDEPVVPRPPVADLAGGAYAAMAICAALVRREKTGAGDRIDVAMTDILVSWTASGGPVVDSTGEAVPVDLPGYGVYRAADGWVTLGVLSETHFWDALMIELGLDDLVGMAFAERINQIDDLNDRLSTAIGVRRRDDLVNGLAAAGVPVAPVRSRDEVMGDPLLTPNDHPIRFTS